MPIPFLVPGAIAAASAAAAAVGIGSGAKAIKKISKQRASMQKHKPLLIRQSPPPSVLAKNRTRALKSSVRPNSMFWISR